jgi:hypothetical protein
MVCSEERFVCIREQPASSEDADHSGHCLPHAPFVPPLNVCL